MEIDNTGLTSTYNNWESSNSSSHRPCTILLIGSTGSGKSSTGNSILGRKAFKPKPIPGAKKGNSTLQSETMKNGQLIHVIDTPGFFDADGEEKLISDEMFNCLNLAKDGIHVLLLVFSLQKTLSREEETALLVLKDIFGPRIADHLIVVFTSLDVLANDNETLDQFLDRGLLRPLQEILDACQHRRVFINNELKHEAKEEQLQELLGLINGVVEQNGGKPIKPFANEIVQELEEKSMGISYGGQYFHDGDQIEKPKQFELKLTEATQRRRRAKMDKESRSLPTNATKPLSTSRTWGSTSDNDKAFDVVDNQWNIVLFGLTGNGKSSTGNSILGTKVFNTKANFKDTPVRQNATTINEQIINVIDTPGLFNSKDDQNSVNNEIFNCINLAKNGVHALLMVLSVKARFSTEDSKVLQVLEDIFGHQIYNYIIFVFTGLDELEGQTPDQFLCQGFPQPLQKILDTHDAGIVFFDNETSDKAKREEQMQKLVSFVNKVVERNNGKPIKTKIEGKNRTHHQDHITGMQQSSKSQQSTTKVSEQYVSVEEYNQERERRIRLEETVKGLEEDVKVLKQTVGPVGNAKKKAPYTWPKN